MSQKGISQSFIWLRIKIKWGVRDKNVGNAPNLLI